MTIIHVCICECRLKFNTVLLEYNAAVDECIFSLTK